MGLTSCAERVSDDVESPAGTTLGSLHKASLALEVPANTNDLPSCSISTKFTPEGKDQCESTCYCSASSNVPPGEFQGDKGKAKCTVGTGGHETWRGDCYSYQRTGVNVSKLVHTCAVVSGGKCMKGTEGVQPKPGEATCSTTP